jgi:glycine cleavage system aminomethyltransferase T
MSYGSLEEKLKHYGDAAEMLRNAPVGAYVYPVPPEHTNFRDEQRALREDVVLMDQSFHMTDLYVSGPDALKLFSSLAVNTFKNFGRNKAKQIVCCNHEGYIIGDAILFGLEDDLFSVVGRPPLANWIAYNAEISGLDVRTERDERSVDSSKQRKTYRFELQGPKAWALIEKLNGAPLGEIKFFSMLEINIAGKRIRALRHGMGGAPGLEFWGPVEEGPDVKAAIIEAGKEFGLRQFGGRAYSAVAHESGWVPSPLPAIYTSEKMKPYREWLKATSFEASASLGGSFYPGSVEGFYLTPWDLDYGRLVKFDHEFLGREALEQMANQKHRTKVTLEWNAEDVLAIHRSQLEPGENGKYMEHPTAHYASHPYDCVMVGDRTVGVSFYPAYLSSDRQWISLAVVEADAAEFGNEVMLIWGERDGGSAKPGVERHFQKKVRAVVTPWPYAKDARTNYRKPA